MITIVNTLEQVLKNIEPFDTKEDITHEIKTMLHEAENELNKEALGMLQQELEDPDHTDKEKQEIKEDIENIKKMITEG